MFNKNKKPFSLRARFLMATAGVILALSLSYGLVAVVGYIVSFDKTAFRLLRGESNLFFSLAQWKDNKLTIAIPPDIDLNFPTLVFIYDDKGNLLWSQRKVPELEKLINKEWLEESGFYEIDTDTRVSSEVLGDNPKAQDQLKNYDDTDQNALTHSVAVNTYAATPRLPALTIVVVDSIPQELQRSDVVWEWFSYVLLANLCWWCRCCGWRLTGACGRSRRWSIRWASWRTASAISWMRTRPASCAGWCAI